MPGLVKNPSVYQRNKTSVNHKPPQGQVFNGQVPPRQAAAYFFNNSNTTLLIVITPVRNVTSTSG